MWKWFFGSPQTPRRNEGVRISTTDFPKSDPNYSRSSHIHARPPRLPTIDSLYKHFLDRSGLSVNQIANEIAVEIVVPRDAIVITNNLLVKLDNSHLLFVDDMKMRVSKFWRVDTQENRYVLATWVHRNGTLLNAVICQHRHIGRSSTLSFRIPQEWGYATNIVQVNVTKYLWPVRP